ncbi:pentatricopeptide repeat-containing protein At1g59720, chloroplastic/mitochondrial-like [Rutidosis leptorrhynchoides]|uniref:pentatricopeptide repeat-containing protein At1g59720, chloroplastic/mitochondrial-like n=1 Tax=Rutidosis leptorrhynchoides TaxID=125765 RepID=UPI003A9A1BAE
MVNIYFKFIKPTSKWKPFSLLQHSLQKHNLFHRFSSHTPIKITNQSDKIYSQKEQAFLINFKKCCTKKHIEQLHAHMVKDGFFQNLFLVGKVIVFCAVSNENYMDYAVSVFEKIDNPDGFLWNTMIRGFGNMNEVDKVFCYFNMMHENGLKVDNFTLSFLAKASGQSGSVLLGKQVHCSVVKQGLECHVYVINTLIHMYGVLKYVRVARQLFDEMPEPNLVGWNTIIDCHNSCGEHKKALELFSRMQHAGVKPDNATLAIVLSACAELGELGLGKWVHSIIDPISFVKDVCLVNSLINMYTRCGEIQEAQKIFDRMNDKNIVTWSTMILGLATHGYVHEALGVFSRMISEKHATPNDVAFLGVLTACSHGGMIEEGRQYFNMINDYNMEPTIKHYGCMVDMLSRAGLVTEAYDLVQDMPMKYNAIIWRTLLAGCHTHGDIKLAEKVRQRLLELEPDHSSDYVLLSNTYAGLEDWNQVSKVRRSMAANGVQKLRAGNSFIGLP